MMVGRCSFGVVLLFLLVILTVPCVSFALPRPLRRPHVGGRASVRLSAMRAPSLDDSLSSTACVFDNSLSDKLCCTHDRRTLSKLIHITGGASPVVSLIERATSSPSSLFHSLSLSLLCAALLMRARYAKNLLSHVFSLPNNRTQAQAEAHNTHTEHTATQSVSAVRRLQRDFLCVFWLLRMSDWLQGPFFFEVYRSKALSLPLISALFLTGFLSTALFAAPLGRYIDLYGRKRFTLLFTLCYALSALSTHAQSLPLLFAGRVLGGIGSALLSSAPEAWLCSEHSRLPQRTHSQTNTSLPSTSSSNVEHASIAYVERERDTLGETFSLAFGGDALIAIAAGEIATVAARRWGPTGPFSLSASVLGLAAVAITFIWRENRANSTPSDSVGNDSVPAQRTSMRDAVRLLRTQRSLTYVGLTQALFEAAMYIFVLQWPPALSAAIHARTWRGKDVTVPFGEIFSCLMTCCLLGTTVWTRWRARVASQLLSQSTPHKQSSSPTMSVERAFSAVLCLAALSMALAAVCGTHSLALLVFSFFVFEFSVGVYFPVISALRAKYLPAQHRALLQNLFAVPLNLLVVLVFLSIDKLGQRGALACSALALALSALSMGALSLQNNTSTKNKKEVEGNS